MKLNEPDSTIVQETIVSEAEKNELKRARLLQIIKDIDLTYEIELNKLVEISIKIKEQIDKAKTKTKDTYYQSKLEKNNNKIFEALVQYNSSKQALLKQLETLNEGETNAKT